MEGEAQDFFPPKSKYLPLVTGHFYLASCYFSDFFTQHTWIQCALHPGATFCPILHKGPFTQWLFKVSSVNNGQRLFSSSCCCRSLASLRFSSPVRYSDIWWVEIYPLHTVQKAWSLFSQVAGVHWIHWHGCTRCWRELSMEVLLSDSLKYQILREWRALMEEIFEMREEDGQVS